MKIIYLVLVISLLAIFGSLDAKAQPVNESSLQTQEIASNLHVPWEIVFALDGRAFFTERTGNLRVIENGNLVEQPVATIPVARAGEGGLLGLALDPNFEKNHYLYLYYTYSDSTGLYNRIARFTESNDTISSEKILIDKIPANTNHDGGRIKFGPDDKLYITTGEAGRPESAQDITYLGGKILRINSDGTIPRDNPFSGSPVYSYGNRNPQGLDWDPRNGNLIETEHGPSGENSWYAHDKVNLIILGKNYGWPYVIGMANDSRFVNPIYQTGDVTWAPSGATFYTSDKIPDLKGKFLIATLRGQHIEVLTLDKDDKVESTQKIFDGTYGRLRDVVQAPDGSLYILTSNVDGRGVVAPDDDKIIRVVPEFGPVAVLVLAVAIFSIVIFSAKNERLIPR
ncbi:MAG: PEFG-CTERM sorting domain-containing protein [Thaumarchaeota archaeon]|nr:MAG: PEFG-CTERM sorting domain-containing protein [Nitrososphaerota archaeon]